MNSSRGPGLAADMTPFSEGQSRYERTCLRKPNRKPAVVSPRHLWVLEESCAFAISHWSKIP